MTSKNEILAEIEHLNLVHKIEALEFAIALATEGGLQQHDGEFYGTFLSNLKELVVFLKMRKYVTDKHGAPPAKPKGATKAKKLPDKVFSL